MKTAKRNFSTLVAALLGIAMLSNVALAQRAGEGKDGEGLREGQQSSIPCTVRVIYDSGVRNKSNTQNVSVVSGNLYLKDFAPGFLPTSAASFSQTAQDTHFGYTFMNLPNPKDPCCDVKGAVLDVTYHALSSGSADSSTAANDSASVVKNGVSLSSSSGWLWNHQAVTVNQVGARSYSVPAAFVSDGRLSYSAQDDTAIDSLRLRIFACCPDKKIHSGEADVSHHLPK